MSTKSHYAVIAMSDLAERHGVGPIPLPMIAKRQKIPIFYLEQIFMHLRRAGLIESVRGARGGYKLARLPHEIRISEIVLSAGERLKMTACEPNNPLGCMGKKERCAAHHLWAGMGRKILEYLEMQRLSDLAENRKSHAPKGGKEGEQGGRNVGLSGS